MENNQSQSQIVTPKQQTRTLVDNYPSVFSNTIHWSAKIAPLRWGYPSFELIAEVGITTPFESCAMTWGKVYIALTAGIYLEESIAILAQDRMSKCAPSGAMRSFQRS